MRILTSLMEVPGTPASMHLSENNGAQTRLGCTLILLAVELQLLEGVELTGLPVLALVDGAWEEKPANGVGPNQTQIFRIAI
jgi:hypothetical protein